jgi:hypothetical protein
MEFRKVSVLGIGALALAFSACGGATTANVANKTANAANMTVNAVSNATNSAANAVTANGNSATNANGAGSMASADGTVINIDEAGVMMTVPKGMSFSKEGGDTIVKTEDEGVDTRFTVLSEENMDKAFEMASKEIDEYITDAKIESKEPKKSMQNGLEINSWNGTGKASNGDSVQFQLAIISIPDSPKKPLLALTYAEGESLQSHKAELDKFYTSIKKQ